LSLILAGALGNIIDCAFYGVLFDHSYGQVAQFLPEKGYATFFNGKVVDMLSFPLIRTTWPGWMPFWGGQEFIFFRPIFNIADSAICVNAFILIIFYKHSLFASLAKETSTNEG
jgi:signal peptidase II